ncbi:MAG TPA: rhomboid family intramembrane serine protease [Methanocella sp.]|uniref:rhomboid family intramembrane serine protease n=1 Tax=Methanocella sp. TaxID=2052833 RepID=UPI002C5852C6|nr:rhomboid family intramembrane serine protease [Methanocella sp.]HTY91272.1 rhomboid family intramembrane serine protease [Methanocella sp.]
MPDNRCDICGAYELLPFKCKYCGGTFCGAHRLPESHNCSGLQMLRERRPIESKAPVRRKSVLKASVFSLPYSGFYAYAIIAITVIVYVLQLLFPKLTDVFILSASTLLSHPWSVVTSIFLHASLMHLFFNMLALFFFGPLLERRIGSGRFLGIYFGTGIVAGLAQVLVFPGSAVLGASGAIFGVLGVLTVLMPDLKVILYFVPLKMVYVTILFAVLDLYPVLTGTSDGVAHIAHLTGLAFGLAAGFYYREKSKVRNARWQI